MVNDFQWGNSLVFHMWILMHLASMYSKKIMPVSWWYLLFFFFKCCWGCPILHEIIPNFIFHGKGLLQK